MRKYDPYWGQQFEPDHLRDFTVTVTREVSGTEWATFSVQAWSPEDAQAQAEEQIKGDLSHLTWEVENDWTSHGGVQIEQIELEQ